MLTAPKHFVEKKRKSDRLRVIKNVSDRFSSQDDFFNTIIHQQLLINFMVPAGIEEAVEKFIADFEAEQAGNETVHSKHKPFRLLTEQENDRKTYSFQVHAERKNSAALLEKLKTEFHAPGYNIGSYP